MTLNIERDLAHLRWTLPLEKKLGFSVPNGEELVGWASLAGMVAAHIGNFGAGFYQGFTRNKTPSTLCAITLGAGLVSNGVGNGILQALTRASEDNSGHCSRAWVNDIRTSDVLRGGVVGGAYSALELAAGAAVGYAVSTLFE